MALRLAINGLGRVSSQLIRVVDQGGFSDLFEIVAIHDSAGPEGIVRALRNDAVYGPFPREMSLEGDTLTIGEQSIVLSSQSEARNTTWGKSDIPLVIVDGSAAMDASSLDQHLKKGAKKVILPAASALANINLGIGVNEASYDPEAHEIVASAAGAASAIAMFYQLARWRGQGSMRQCDRAGASQWVATDDRYARGPRWGRCDRAAGGRIWPCLRTARRQAQQPFERDGFETPAIAVGSISFGVWLEQRVSNESLRELVQSAAQGDELVGLIGTQDGVTASSDAAA